jgi:hypothetical protein
MGLSILNIYTEEDINMSDRDLKETYENFLKDVTNLSHFPDVMRKLKTKLVKNKLSSKIPESNTSENPCTLDDFIEDMD